MPVSVLGWWRTGLPSRPAQDCRRASGGARKLAAPPAGAANSHPADPPPPTPERSPEEEGSDAQEPGTGHALEKAAAPEAGRALGVAAVLSGARNWGFLLHAVGVHTANLAASLATRPLAPLQARLQAQLACTEAVQAACRQLGVDSLSELQVGAGGAGVQLFVPCPRERASGCTACATAWFNARLPPRARALSWI